MQAIARVNRVAANKKNGLIIDYNGMLKSVWDLLDEVRNQSQATVDGIGAQRDFWIAEADLGMAMIGLCLRERFRRNSR